MRGAGLVACLAAFGLTAATGAAAAAPSPLDLSTTVLAGKPGLVPKGLKKSGDCYRAGSDECAYRGPGLFYAMDREQIFIVEMSRVGGRFLQPLPYGLTGAESMAEMQTAFAKHGLKVAATHDNPNILEGFFTLRNADCWVDLEFGPDGRLAKASLHSQTD